MHMSYLLFAYDAILFCEANLDQLRYWGWAVIGFEVMSSLKINLHKSELISIREVEGVDRLASMFGCMVGRLLTSYLSPPLRMPHKFCVVWDVVKERFRRRLVP